MVINIISGEISLSFMAFECEIFFLVRRLIAFHVSLEFLLFVRFLEIFFFPGVTDYVGTF